MWMHRSTALLLAVLLSSVVWAGEKGELGLRLKHQGLFWEILAINPESAAAKTGVRVGDLVTRINNFTFPSEQQLVDTVATLRPGDVIRISIVDGQGVERSFELEAGSRAE